MYEEICGKDKAKTLRREVKIGESKHYENFPGITGFGDKDKSLPFIFHMRKLRP